MQRTVEEGNDEVSFLTVAGHRIDELVKIQIRGERAIGISVHSFSDVAGEQQAVEPRPVAVGCVLGDTGSCRIGAPINVKECVGGLRPR